MTNFDFYLANIILFLANMTNFILCFIGLILTYFLTNMNNFDLYFGNMTYFWQIWIIFTLFFVK